MRDTPTEQQLAHREISRFSRHCPRNLQYLHCQEVGRLGGGLNPCSLFVQHPANSLKDTGGSFSHAFSHSFIHSNFKQINSIEQSGTETILVN